MDFLRFQSLGYPNYSFWLERSEPEFHSGYKHAVLAFSDNRLVGDGVYQAHKQLPGVMEIKNLRVHPKVRRRDFGHFILKQIEAEAREEKANYNLLMIDARTNQEDIIRLLRFSGYQEFARAPLYESSEEDIVMIKQIKRTDENFILNSKSFFN